MAINVRFAGGAIGNAAIVGQAPGVGGMVYEDVTITGDRAENEAPPECGLRTIPEDPNA
jgi:hypothetical protein